MRAESSGTSLVFFLESQMRASCGLVDSANPDNTNLEQSQFKLLCLLRICVLV